MTEEQIAEYLQRINGLLMCLVGEAAQLGLHQVVQNLEAARISVGAANRLVEPPLFPPASQAASERG